MKRRLLAGLLIAVMCRIAHAQNTEARTDYRMSARTDVRTERSTVPKKNLPARYRLHTKTGSKIDIAGYQEDDLYYSVGLTNGGESRYPKSYIVRIEDLPEQTESEAQPIAPSVPASEPAPATVPQQPNSKSKSSTENRDQPPLKSKPPESQAEIVYVTQTGTKYHRAGCEQLKSSIPISLEEAKKKYTPCSICIGKSDARTSSRDSAPTTARGDSPTRGAVGQTATGKTIYEGPRGGHYHISESGKKVYEKKK